MTQEDKELLLKDLCARLPYGIKASYYGADEECETWDEVDGVVFGCVEIGQYSLPIERVKPYLFPLSSMTDEQWKEITDIQIKESLKSIDSNNDYMSNPLLSIEDLKTIDWLNAHHFDYRNLINKNLAIDCTNLNIY